MTTPLGAAAPSAAAAATRTTGGAEAAGGGIDKDAFLQLLVSSMRYQDPSKPTDGQAYMAQLAQFAQVEKLEALAASQAELGQWQRTLAGQGMLGRTVTGTAETGAVLTGTVSGLTLSSSGPRLQLSGGGTLAVDAVTDVRDPTASATTT